MADRLEEWVEEMINQAMREARIEIIPAVKEGVVGFRVWLNRDAWWGEEYLETEKFFPFERVFDYWQRSMHDGKGHLWDDEKAFLERLEREARESRDRYEESIEENSER